MTTRVKFFVSRFGLTLLVLNAALFWNAGCATRPDPLAGWQFCYSDNPIYSNKAVIDDYQDYIQKLPSKEKQFVQGGVSFFEDRTGQHAVKIEIPYYGVWREHVLIYNKDNKRIKVIIYSNGRYAS